MTIIYLLIGFVGGVSTPFVAYAYFLLHASYREWHANRIRRIGYQKFLQGNGTQLSKNLSSIFEDRE